MTVTLGDTVRASSWAEGGGVVDGKARGQSQIELLVALQKVLTRPVDFWKSWILILSSQVADRSSNCRI